MFFRTWTLNPTYPLGFNLFDLETWLLPLWIQEVFWDLESWILLPWVQEVFWDFESWILNPTPLGSRSVLILNFKSYRLGFKIFFGSWILNPTPLSVKSFFFGYWILNPTPLDLRSLSGFWILNLESYPLGFKKFFDLVF